MKPWIENLLALQKVDMRIINLHLRLKMIPAEIDKLKNKIKNLENKISETKNSLQKTGLEIKQAESSIAELNKHIEKLQQQSSLVKKNTEYQAMLSQIDTSKEKISEIETKMLNLFDRDAENKEKFKEAEKESNTQKSGIEEEIEELTGLMGEVKSEIKELMATRPPLEAKVDTSVLNQYKRLIKTGKAALVRVNSAGICGNCNLKITPQTMNETKKGAVVYCDNCSRLLYF